MSRTHAHSAYTRWLAAQLAAGGNAAPAAYKAEFKAKQSNKKPTPTRKAGSVRVYTTGGYRDFADTINTLS